MTQPTGSPGRVPPLAAARAPRLPGFAERTLDSGLRVVAVRRATVPMVTFRLRVPFGLQRADQLAPSALLDESILLGTQRRSGDELARAAQEVGGELRASVHSDHLSLRGESLREGMPRLLDLLAEVLTSARYPAHEVRGAARRLRDHVRMLRADPGTSAGEALRRRLWGEHPYGRRVPTEDEIDAVDVRALRGLHRRRVVPDGALLLLVGDLSPARALDVASRSLGAWSGRAVRPAAPPPTPRPGALELVHRAGAVQSQLRLGGPGLAMDDPDRPALQLANLIYGGAFSSRLVQNVREVKGYSYSPNSGLHATAGAPSLSISADVATAVTAPALVEIIYELGRIATGPVTTDELEDARSYAIGTLALTTATQAGLAGTLEELLAGGLEVSELRERPVKLAGVGIDAVQEQAARILAPARLVTVVQGDAAQVESSLATLGQVVRC